MSARGLPPPPPGRVYQLWAIVGGTPVSAGTFVPGADGTSRVIAQVSLDAAPGGARRDARAGRRRARAHRAEGIWCPGELTPDQRLGLAAT